MKILIHRYNSICEPDFIEAFQTLGIEVIEETAEMTDKNIPVEKQVATLGEMILTMRPMFVFSINFFPFISLVCEKLGIMYVCVSVDCPVAELFNTQIKNKCNRVFLFDYKQYLQIHDENPDCIFYLPLGVNVDRINRTIGEPCGNRQYKYDISFVGSLYNEKNPYAEIYEKLTEQERTICDQLLAKQEEMGGQEWLEENISLQTIEAIKRAAGEKFYSSALSVRNIDDFVAVNKYLSTELTVRDRLNLMYVMSTAFDGIAGVHLFTRSETHELKESGCPLEYHGGVKSLTEMPAVFRQSRININPTMRSIQTGLPQRIWDVCGCGGFLLTNFQAEIPEYFVPGKHLAAYETIEEACELAAYYLEHEDERSEIARNGYELVKEKHSVLNRVINIINVICPKDNV